MAARLIQKAGSLTSLAKCPASTVQVKSHTLFFCWDLWLSVYVSSRIECAYVSIDTHVLKNIYILSTYVYICTYFLYKNIYIPSYTIHFSRTEWGQFEPLVISTSGRITANTRKLLDVICQKPSGDNARIRSNRILHQYWLSKISFTLSKTIANEIIIRSAKVNGRQYDQNSSSANNSFPDSLDIHLEMSR